jgi:hypothetical protein
MTTWKGRQVHVDRCVTAVEANANYPSGYVVSFKSRYPEVDREGDWPGVGFADLKLFVEMSEGAFS